jgi:general stress protein 26
MVEFRLPRVAREASIHDLDRWFEQGIDTPNIVLIRVKASWE